MSSTNTTEATTYEFAMSRHSEQPCSQPKAENNEKGTTFRFYKEDGTHYTAVQIKDNKVLEVKNPNSSEKKIYDSLAEWLETIGAKENQLKVDTMRVKESRVSTNSAEKAKDKPRVGKTSEGFSIPRDKHLMLNKWFRWVYKIIKEACPELLISEDVKNAYNNLVEICLKDSDIMSDYYFTGKMPYSIDLISYYPNSRNMWSGIDGFKIFFNSERYGRDSYSTKSDYYYNPTTVILKKEKNVYDGLRNEIANAYKALFDLIYKPIHKHINMINKKKSLESSIAHTKKRIEHTKKVISRLTARYAQSLNSDRTALERYEKELADLN